MESNKRAATEIQQEYQQFMAELGQLSLNHMEASEALAKMNARTEQIRAHVKKLQAEHAEAVAQEAKDAGNDG
jgi:septal ring factor EnvC (AmiA/AmiB activator)